MFRNLIPRLSDRYRVVAPDLPGFGYTRAPARGIYPYTFGNLYKAVRSIQLFDTGHFALETDGPEIAAVIGDFLARKSD